MRVLRIILTSVAAVGAVLAASITGPATVNANPQVQGCVNASGVSACTNFNVPNINAVANAIPNISVPNINVPHINVPHGRW
ncbi:MAG: hypothetical protein FGM50_09460 [Mycobacterium sp.]|nr:hypothetical protein [Mycobacterium sp.]